MKGGVSFPRPLYRPLPPRIKKLVEIAAEENGTTIDLIMSGSRFKNVTLGRQAACRYIRRAGFSFPEIGRFLGIHHTSAVYAERGKEPAHAKEPFVITADHWTGAA